MQIENGIAQRDLQHKPHLVLLNRSFYNKELRTLLSRWMVVWLSLQQPSFQGGVTLKDEQMLRYLLTSNLQVLLAWATLPRSS